MNELIGKTFSFSYSFRCLDDRFVEKKNNDFSIHSPI